MTPRRAALTAPFRWLIDAIDVGRHQPQIVLGAIIATALVGLLPSLPQQLMALSGATPGVGLIVMTQALGFVFGLLVIPVLHAGIYRILDGAERGAPQRVGKIFDGFSDGSYGRIVGVAVLGALLMAGLFVLIAIVMAFAVGIDGARGLQAWMEAVMKLQTEAQASGQPIPPAKIEALGVPSGLGAIIGVLFAFTPIWLFLALGTAWALVSVALRGAGPIEAILVGLRAAFVNALPLLGLLLALGLPLLLIGGLLVMVLGALVGVVSAISPGLGNVVTLLLFTLISIVIAAISFGFVLNGWRGICDDADAAPPANAPPVAGFEA